MNTSPSLSPPGSDLDGLELESLRASRDHAPGTGVALDDVRLSQAAMCLYHAGFHDLGEYIDSLWYPVVSAEQVDVPQSRDELLSKISQLEAELKRRDEALAHARAFINNLPIPTRGATRALIDMQQALQPQEGGDA